MVLEHTGPDMPTNCRDRALTLPAFVTLTYLFLSQRNLIAILIYKGREKI